MGYLYFIEFLLYRKKCISSTVPHIQGNGVINPDKICLDYGMGKKYWSDWWDWKLLYGTLILDFVLGRFYNKL